MQKHIEPIINSKGLNQRGTQKLKPKKTGKQVSNEDLRRSYAQ